jgi:hypothetical protein
MNNTNDFRPARKVPELDLARLRSIAEAVGDRPRDWEWAGGYPQQVISQGNVHLIAECYEDPDSPSTVAEYIATFDPRTILALLAEVERLRVREQEQRAASRRAYALIDQLEAERDDLRAALADTVPEAAVRKVFAEYDRRIGSMPVIDVEDRIVAAAFDAIAAIRALLPEGDA